MTDPLSPGSVIGILGGGQLGRMLACAAARLGFDVHIFCPEQGGPAARVAAHETCAAYSDGEALGAFASGCDVITYEFENVPVAAVAELIEAGVPVRPGAKALECSQDRLVEKRFLREAGIDTVAFEPIDDPGAIMPALLRLGGNGLLKRRRDGYDGKGQARIAVSDDAAGIWNTLGGVPCILEAIAPFEGEISAIVARGADGATATYEPSRNTHAGGILRSSVVPSGFAPSLLEAASSAALGLADALDYVGILALEFFVMPDGSLLANEYAPRVHNSGHWTPEACDTGQFEQHIRAVAGLPLASTTRRFDVRMDNLLGAEAEAAFGEPGVTIYGKGEPRPGRKMGHRVTRIIQS